MLNRYIGDKAFYRRILTIGIPIIIQNTITNFVQLLDNVMVGQVGTLQMSGVSIVNSLIFVFNLCVFGAASGAGIYVSQYYGSGNNEGIRHTFRFKILFNILLSVLGICLFLFGGDQLIGLYLTGEGTPVDINATLHFGREYLFVMLWGLLPFALNNAYVGTLRECGQTVVPMISGIVAVFVNLFLNYVLIFGHFGAPAMGVVGAAWATVISRYVEFAIVSIWAHTHTKALPFIKGLFSSLRIPGKLIGTVMLSSLPLMFNETFWAAGEAMLTQIFSTRGLDVVPAVNISSTILNLCNISVLSLGGVVGIILGQMQGARCPAEELKDTFRKTCVFAVVLSFVFGGILASVSGVFPLFYNTTESVRHLSTIMILISAGQMPLVAYAYQTYYTIRSGGKTGITFLFDAGFSWLVMIPITFCLCHFTDLSIIWVYLASRASFIIKCLMGWIIMKKVNWIQNLTEQ